MSATPGMLLLLLLLLLCPLLSLCRLSWCSLLSLSRLLSLHRPSCPCRSCRSCCRSLSWSGSLSCLVLFRPRFLLSLCLLLLPLLLLLYLLLLLFCLLPCLPSCLAPPSSTRARWPCPVWTRGAGMLLGLGAVRFLMGKNDIRPSLISILPTAL